MVKERAKYLFFPIFLMRNSFLEGKTPKYVFLHFAGGWMERGEPFPGAEPGLCRSPPAQYSVPKCGDEIL